MATLCKTCKKPIRFLKSFADMSKRTKMMKWRRRGGNTHD